MNRCLHNISLGSYIALIFLCALWEGWLAPFPKLPPGFLLAVKTIPLLVPLFGLLRNNTKAYLWSSLLVLLYFIEGVTLSYSYRHDPWAFDGVRLYAMLETVLVIIYFTTALLYLHRR